MLEPGDQVPDIPELSALRGKRVVLYFYPKADTPGCTLESCEFRDHASAFQKKGATVVGISPDKPAAQEKFVLGRALGLACVTGKEVEDDQ